MKHNRAMRRPMLRWHGGKWRLAPWIIGHFPPHRRYVEPYGGAASVLLRKPRSYGEIWNDLDDGVWNLMKVLQGGRRDELVQLLHLTPFSRQEYELSHFPSDDPIEMARRLIIRSFMGYGSNGHNLQVRTGFRGKSIQSNTTPARDWMNIPGAIDQTARRVMGVVIDHRPALDVIRDHDGEDALIFLDPPYLPGLRSDKSRKGGGKYHAYSHEMTTEDHVEMLELLTRLNGMVVLCGYPSELYDGALPGWTTHEIAALADGALPRVEKIWMNPAAVQAGAWPTLLPQEKEMA